jgi:hypothetical protein
MRSGKVALVPRVAGSRDAVSDLARAGMTLPHLASTAGCLGRCGPGPACSTGHPRVGFPFFPGDCRPGPRPRLFSVLRAPSESPTRRRRRWPGYPVKTPRTRRGSSPPPSRIAARRRPVITPRTRRGSSPFPSRIAARTIRGVLAMRPVAWSPEALMGRSQINGNPAFRELRTERSFSAQPCMSQGVAPDCREIGRSRCRFDLDGSCCQIFSR